MAAQNSKSQMLLILTVLFSHLISIAFAQNPLQEELQSEISAIANVTSNNYTTPQTPVYRSWNREFLDAHNKVRLHAGEPLFQWDRQLARYARRFAKQRAHDCLIMHSHGPFGENVFWGGGGRWTPTDAVRAWVREHKYYNRATNECESGKLCGHYTQIVWKDSTRLGCARVKCLNGDVFAVCAYDPPGNYVNESPFQENKKGNAPTTTV